MIPVPSDLFSQGSMFLGFHFSRALLSHCAMFQPNVPWLPCSQGFIFPELFFQGPKSPLCCVSATGSHVPRVPYSQSSMFWEISVPRTLSFHCAVFQPKIPRVLCFPGTLFPVSNVPSVLCLHGPMFQPNIPRLPCSYRPICPGSYIPRVPCS